MQKGQKLEQERSREYAKYRQAQQDFHSSYSEAQRNREQWYNQKEHSRHWDSFNTGHGSKRSPKQKNNYRSNSNRTEAGGGYHSKENGTRANTSNAPAGSYYSLLGVSVNASVTEIKKAYRKVRRSSHISHFLFNFCVFLIAD